MKACRQCRKQLNPFQKKFCSVTCKGKNQEKRIILSCDGCGKEFSILPYLKRKSNYCSQSCYWRSTTKGKIRQCIQCGQDFYAANSLLRKHFGIYCSFKCQHYAYAQKRIKFICKQCGKNFQKSPSVAKTHPAFCSKNCYDDSMRDYVEKVCRNCQQKFQLPRWELNKGKGTFCSRDCFIQFKGETAIEKKMRQVLESANIEFNQEVKIGIYRADFLFAKTKTIIECDGDYWHQIAGAVERDRRKDDYLIKKGYQIIRIPEKDIRVFSIRQLMKMLQSSHVTN